MATPSDQAARLHACYSHRPWLNQDTAGLMPVAKIDEVYSGTHQPSIPVIDLMDLNVTEFIIQACETWGFFQLISHGIPQKLVEDVESEAHRLFALPIEQKLKELRTSTFPSSGYGNPPWQLSLPRKLWHEGFTIMGSPVDQARMFWPHDYQGFW